jgi:hypothetical protein
MERSPQHGATRVDKPSYKGAISRWRTQDRSAVGKLPRPRFVTPPLLSEAVAKAPGRASRPREVFQVLVVKTRRLYHRVELIIYSLARINRAPMQVSGHKACKKKLKLRVV